MDNIENKIHVAAGKRMPFHFGLVKGNGSAKLRDVKYAGGRPRLSIHIDGALDSVCDVFVDRIMPASVEKVTSSSRQQRKTIEDSNICGSASCSVGPSQ